MKKRTKIKNKRERHHFLETKINTASIEHRNIDCIKENDIYYMQHNAKCNGNIRKIIMKKSGKGNI